jgi:hypothetical protein
MYKLVLAAWLAHSLVLPVISQAQDAVAPEVPTTEPKPDIAAELAQLRSENSRLKQRHRYSQYMV